MQLACPACHTAFHIEPAALGADGRSVRCARCRNTWFARPNDLIPASAMEVVSAKGEAVFAEMGPEETGHVLPQVVSWNDMVMVDVQSPSLTPLLPPVMAVPAVQSSPKAGAEQTISNVGRRRSKKSDSSQTRLGFVALLLGFIVVIGTTAREPLVRAFPDLAGYYAAIGIPVNLRGLEFHGLRTMHEVQDGVPVLIVEGDISNPTRQSKEIPRLRLAVTGQDDQEIYSWTAQLSRDSLGAREILTFRSRLASPPESSKQVTVRFQHPTDLAESGH